MSMDYVTKNGIITKEQRADNVAALLAYDMAFAKLVNERKESNNYA